MLAYIHNIDTVLGNVHSNSLVTIKPALQLYHWREATKLCASVPQK